MRTLMKERRITLGEWFREHDPRREGVLVQVDQKRRGREHRAEMVTVQCRCTEVDHGTRSPSTRESLDVQRRTHNFLSA